MNLECGTMTELTPMGLNIESLSQQPIADFLDHDPTKTEKIEVRRKRHSGDGIGNRIPFIDVDLRLCR